MRPWMIKPMPMAQAANAAAFAAGKMSNKPRTLTRVPMTIKAMLIIVSLYHTSACFVKPVGRSDPLSRLKIKNYKKCRCVQVDFNVVRACPRDNWAVGPAHLRDKLRLSYLPRTAFGCTKTGHNIMPIIRRGLSPLRGEHPGRAAYQPT